MPTTCRTTSDTFGWWLQTRTASFELSKKEPTHPHYIMRDDLPRATTWVHVLSSFVSDGEGWEVCGCVGGSAGRLRRWRTSTDVTESLKPNSVMSTHGMWVEYRQSSYQCCFCRTHVDSTPTSKLLAYKLQIYNAPLRTHISSRTKCALTLLPVKPTVRAATQPSDSFMRTLETECASVCVEGGERQAAWLLASCIMLQGLQPPTLQQQLARPCQPMLAHYENTGHMCTNTPQTNRQIYLRDQERGGFKKKPTNKTYKTAPATTSLTSSSINYIVRGDNARSLQALITDALAASAVAAPHPATPPTPSRCQQRGERR